MYDELYNQYGSIGIDKKKIKQQEKRLSSRTNLKPGYFEQWNYEKELEQQQQDQVSNRYADLIDEEYSQRPDENEKILREKERKEEEEIRREKREVSNNEKKWKEEKNWKEYKKYKTSVTTLLKNICKKLDRFFQIEGMFAEKKYFINDQNSYNLKNTISELKELVNSLQKDEDAKIWNL